MKSSKVALLLALCCIVAGAQEKPKDTKPVTPADRIKVSDKVALRIRDAQVLSIALRERQASAQKELQDAIAAAYDEAKVSQKDYTINDDTWELVKIASTPPPVAAVSTPIKPAPAKDEVKKEPAPAKKK